MTGLYDFDLFFARLANGLLRGAGTFFTPLFKIITLAGNGNLVFIIAAILLSIFRKTRKAGVTGLVAILSGVIITNLALKNIIARARPFTDLQSPFYQYWIQAGSLPENGYSFPSGHTTAAAAFALTLFLSFRKRYSWLSFSIPVIMGFTRIYFGVHYASDVFAGIAVGIICGVFAHFIMRLLLCNSVFNNLIEIKGMRHTSRSKYSEDNNAADVDGENK